MFEFVENNKLAIKVILGAIALTFVGFGVGSYSSVVEDPYLAKVGHAKIVKQDLDRALEGRPADAAVRQAVLENLIRQELLLAASGDAHVAVSPEQLRQAIASIPAFQDNGKFSQAKYKEFLANRYPSPAAFEAQVRRDLLLQGALAPFANEQLVSGALLNRLGQVMGETRFVSRAVFNPTDYMTQAKVDDAAVKAFYQANTKRFQAPEAVRLEYVMLTQEALAEAQTVTDAEVQQYYDQHRNELTSEERRVAHILLAVPKDAPAAARAKVRAEAEALLKEVRANPGRFGELAKARSQDPGSAANGGDLGFFGKGMMVKPFEDVAFRMKPGQISEVVETEFGYHILRLEEVKGADLAKLKPEIEMKLKRQKAAGLFRSQNEKLAELAYQQPNSLKAVAEGLKLEIQTSDWVGRGAQGAQGVLASPKVLEAAFSDDVIKGKHNSEPVEAANGVMVVVRAKEHRPARQLPLAEVQDAIRQELLAKESAKLAEKQGEAVLAALRQGTQPAGLPAFGQPLSISRRALGDLGLNEVRAVFAVPSGKLPGYAGVKRDNGTYVIYRVEKVEAGQASQPQEKAQLSQVVSEMYANAQVAAYLESLRQKYPVVMGKLATEQ